MLSEGQVVAVRGAFSLAGYDGELRTLPVTSEDERIFVLSQDDVLALRDVRMLEQHSPAEYVRPALPRVASVLPEPVTGRNDQAARPSVAAGQDRCSDEYPRRDSNPRYRLERAAC